MPKPDSPTRRAKLQTIQYRGESPMWIEVANS